jgi:hypothetical protein
MNDFEYLATMNKQFADCCSNTDFTHDDYFFEVSEWNGNFGISFKSTLSSNGLKIVCKREYFDPEVVYEQTLSRQEVHKMFFENIRMKETIERLEAKKWWEIWK